MGICTDYRTVDLHIHSYFSDGTMSPKQIIEEAVKRNVGMISITDHDVLEGTLELNELGENYDIKCIPGVEIDAFEEGVNFHILAYDFDVNDKIFAEFVKTNRTKLEKISDRLILLMQSEHNCLSYSTYDSYAYDRSRGGWKALHYLIDSGVCADFKDAVSMYNRYHCSYESADFLDVRATCNVIHRAGGKAVLAHPGRVVEYSCMMEFKDKLEKIAACGLSGIECFYPSHSKEITDICLDLCKRKNMLITCGSDCHGGSEGSQIGELPVLVKDIRL